MERKRKSEGDFRQDTSFEGKEVFDCPGVDDDGETAGTVPRHAFIACRKAFKNLEKRYEESEKQNDELRSALKQGGRKGLDSQALQERDDLQHKLERSYLAFKEKYLENEQLKKRVADLESMRLGQESVASRKSEASPSSAFVPEDEKNSEEGKYAVVLKLLEKIGLEVIEDSDDLFVILTDRDKLKKWMLECCDGNVKIEFERCIVVDKTTETEEQEKRTNGDAGVTIVNQGAEAEGQELRPVFKVVKEAMEQRGQTSAQTEQGLGVEQVVDLRSPPQNEPTYVVVARQRRDIIHQNPEWSVFEKVRSQAANMLKVKDHLDKQKSALGTLVALTRKASQELSRIVTPSPLHNTNTGQTVRKTETNATTRSHRLEEGTFEHLSEDTPLSLPVQETEEHRVRRVGEPLPIIEERSRKDQAPRASSPVTPSTEGAEGGAVSMTTVASQSTWTGESDIEVIEEDEEILAATSFQGRMCPMCEAYFPQRVSQAEFEFHVTQHFEESVD